MKRYGLPLSLVSVVLGVFGAGSVVLGAGCSTPPTCPAGFIGDSTQAPEAVLLITDGVSHVLKEVHQGDAIPLEPPPQGGYVFYVGAKVRNVDACGIQLAGTLRDPDSGDRIGYDARTTDLLLTADGWGQPDPGNNANVANVNGCPDYGAKDVQGKPYQLEMYATDRSGRTAKVTASVVPTCMQSNPLVQQDCLCNCSANYMLGKTCMPGNPDGGADGG